jgi:hypothetical protein
MAHVAPAPPAEAVPVSQFQQLKGELAWLAGSLAAVTALLYAFGFLAIQAHMNLLGIARLVEVQNQDYLITGATFLAYLPLYLVIGLAPWGIALLVVKGIAAAVPRARDLNIAHEASLLLMLMLLVVLLAAWVLWLAPPLGLLLRGEEGIPGPLHRLILQGPKGQDRLQVAFSAYVGVVAIFLLFGTRLWIWDFPQGWRRALRWVYTIFLFQGLVLIPIGYGLYIIQIKYPRASIQIKEPKTDGAIEGWILNRNLGGEEKALLYSTGTQSGVAKGIIMIAKDSYSSITITGNDFVFSPHTDGPDRR